MARPISVSRSKVPTHSAPSASSRIARHIFPSRPSANTSKPPNFISCPSSSTRCLRCAHYPPCAPATAAPPPRPAPPHLLLQRPLRCCSAIAAACTRHHRLATHPLLVSRRPRVVLHRPTSPCYHPIQTSIHPHLHRSIPQIAHPCIPLYSANP